MNIELTWLKFVVPKDIYFNIWYISCQFFSSLDCFVHWGVITLILQSSIGILFWLPFRRILISLWCSDWRTFGSGKSFDISDFVNLQQFWKWKGVSTSVFQLESFVYSRQRWSCKWVQISSFVPLSSERIHLLFLHFDLDAIKITQLFFSQRSLFKTFLIVISNWWSHLRKHTPRVLSCVGRRAEPEFPFIYLLVFMLSNLRVCSEGVSWETTLCREAGSLPLRVDVRSLLGPFPRRSWSLKCPFPLTPSPAESSSVSSPDTSLPVVVRVSWAYTLSLLPFLKKHATKPNFSWWSFWL